MLLSGYDYDIVYKRSADNANADFFSRCLVQTRDEEDPDPDEHCVFATAISSLPVTAVEIADFTKLLTLDKNCVSFKSVGRLSQSFAA